MNERRIGPIALLACIALVLWAYSPFCWNHSRRVGAKPPCPKEQCSR